MPYSALTPSALLLPLLAANLVACGDDGAADPTTTTSPDDTSSSTAAPTTGDEPTGGDTDTTTSQPGTTTADPTTDPTTTLSSTSDPSTSTGTSDPDTTTAPDTDTDTGEGWQPPACDMVTGTGAVTFSHDQGATLAPMDQQIVPVTYTFGLVALGKPGFMLAGSGQQILASTDAGCSWHSIGAAGDGNSPAVRLVAAGDTRAYGFGDNNSIVVRVDDEVVTTLKAPGAPDGIVGLGVDPDDPDHVRVGDASGQLWDSTDAGVVWNPLGTLPDGVIAYRVAFDPRDIDHVAVGSLAAGVQSSFDGGAEWHKATGLGSGEANGFNLVVSPADGDIVWVEGLDLEDPDDATSRHIWRSEDGGLTFAAVVDSADATLYNGNHLFAHPTDPDVLYFVFGSNFQGHGTDLYRYDHADAGITMTHNKWHDTVITFLPGDPGWIYLGLSIEP